MKFLNAMMLSSVLVLSISCGKDGGGGGGGATAFNASNLYNTANPFYQVPSAQTQQVITDASAWYTSTSETSTASGTKTEARSSLKYNPAQCSTKTYLGFIDLESCKSVAPTITALPARTVSVATTGSKAANAKLAQVFAPGNGATILSASQGSSVVWGQRLYILKYVKPNGHILQYTIDTGLNSAFNPVEIYDSELASGEVVTNPAQLL